MFNFKTYIAESAEAKTAFENVRPLLILASDKYKKLGAQHIATLTKAAEDKEIYNARFIEASTGLMSMIQTIYRSLLPFVEKLYKDNEGVSEVPFSVHTVSDIKKLVKVVSKIKVVSKELKDFIEHIKDLPDAMAIVKGYVKKGREPKPVDPSKTPTFIKPLASFDATKSAINFMKEAAASFEKELTENIKSQIMNAYDNIRGITIPSDLPRDSNSVAVASAIFVVKTKEGKKFLEKLPDADRRVTKLINDTVQDIVDGFVSKSASKLAVILQKKGLPKSHSIVRTNVRNGMVENMMKFEFEDNSSFNMESSVVYKYSAMGKLFFQYPTRFKDVKLADGTKMKMPSEEKIIKEF